MLLLDMPKYGLLEEGPVIFRNILFILSIILFSFICLLFYGDIKKNYRRLDKKRKKSTKASVKYGKRTKFNRVY